MDLFGQQIKAKLKDPLLLRFLGAIMVPAILLCLSISFGLLNIHKQYLFTQREIIGTQAVYHLFEAFIDLQEIRGLSRIVPRSEAQDPGARRHEVMVKFKSHFNTPQWQELSQEFGIGQEINTILLEVDSLYDVNNETLSEQENFELYTAIIDKINSVILIVADRSNLILDPELDTYYLMEIAVKQIPDLCEAFASIRGIGSGMIAQGYSKKDDDDKFFQERISILQEQLKKFARAKLIIHEATPDAQLSFKDSEIKLGQLSASFLQICQSLTEDMCTVSADNFFQSGSGVIDVLVESFHSSIEMLENRLRQRLVSQFRLLIVIILISIITLVAIFYFALSFYKLQQDTHQELARISITDSLTSIPNRRYLDMVFDREIHRARRDGKAIAFGLLDIDFFKRFNDSYGHYEGDLALKKVAGALVDSLQRAGDYYFRYGGEEFCFVCTSISLAETKKIGERIRSAVEQLEIDHQENTASSFVTISIGVVFVAEVTTEDLDYLIKQADDLLYKAKGNGRNQCITVAIT